MLKYLPELIRDNVIDHETADRITSYYLQKRSEAPSKFLIIFGILGALLIGMGVILILAHNWDDFPKWLRTFIAFLPLVLSQTASLYTLYGKSDVRLWREVSATFLFLSVGITIALISQIYHISGELDKFLLTWMIIAAPIIYLLKSSFATLLYIAGITYYASTVSYWFYVSKEPYYYWLMLLFSFPYYYQALKNNQRNFIRFYNFLTSISLLVVFGTFAYSLQNFTILLYSLTFGLMMLSDYIPLFKNYRSEDKTLYSLGYLGNFIMLFILSFDWYWHELYTHTFKFNLLTFHHPIILFFMLFLTIYLVYRKWKDSSDFQLIDLSSLIIFILVLIGIIKPSFSQVLMNLFILIISLYGIIVGVKSMSIATLNRGLGIFTILVLCRFFDRDIPFVVRGVVFVVIGLGFFYANHRIMRKIKNEK